MEPIFFIEISHCSSWACLNTLHAVNTCISINPRPIEAKLLSNQPSARALTGDFIITIDGEEVLRGIFVPPVVSRSYPSTEVVIVYPSFQSDYHTMKIQMGYPWDEPTEYDPRNDNMMMQYFDLLNKLTQ